MSASVTNAWHLALQFMARDNRWLRSTIMPNFTPVGWWENDVFEITGAGYWIEYEIKVSRGDFFADAKKYNTEYPEGFQWDPVKKEYPKGVQRTKHERLADGDIKGPNRFYFLVPKGLVKPEEIPAWAGLIYAYKNEADDRYIRFDQVVKAPLIHKSKLDENHKHRSGVLKCCYGRLHGSIGFGQPVTSRETVPYCGPEGAD